MKKLQNLLSKYLNSFRFKIHIIILFSMVSFTFITYLVINEKLNAFVKRANIRAWILENYMDSLIKDSRQIMYGLANNLSVEKIDAKNDYIKQVLSHFNYDLRSYKSIPFFGFKIYDADDVLIYHSLIPMHIFKPMKGFSDIETIEKLKYSPFEFIVGPIRITKVGGERIIPLCIGLNDVRDMSYTGALCAGLTTTKISERLNLAYSTRHHNQMEIINNSFLNDKEYYQIENVFNLRNMFRYIAYNEKFFIKIPLSNYPFFIKVTLHFKDLIIEVLIILSYCLAYFAVYLLTIYLLFAVYKKQYKKPLELITEKVNRLPGLQDKKTFRDAYNDLFKNEAFRIINNIIDSYGAICIAKEEKKSNASALELHDSILSLILTERKKLSSTHMMSNVFSKKLKNLVYEELTEVELNKFFTNIKKYANERFNNLDIKISLNKKDHAIIALKQSALSETILNIFSLINIHCIANKKKVKCILKVSFVDESLLPNISVEIASQIFIESFDWIAENSYIYNGLLSIYSLAKYNDLLFYIFEKEENIIFNLDPINNTSLEELKRFL